MSPAKQSHAESPTTAPESASATTPASSPFPTFLDQDPYPAKSRDGNRPQSSTSVTTDATSEFGENDFRSAKERQSVLTTVTGAVGEPGLPPSRPTSAGVSEQSGSTARASKRTSMQPPSSRRGPVAVFSAAGARGNDASRPNSSLSKTHVPTLTAQGFFRPMSSSKLQAQRNQQPSALGQNLSPASQSQDQEEETKRARRYSNASVNTLRDAKAAAKQPNEDAPPLPVSRGTQFTNEAEGNAASSVTSATPLQTRTNAPKKLEVNGLRSSNTPSAENKTPKSTRSFRTSLGIGSRSSKQDVDRRPSPKYHERLDSHPSSGQDGIEKPLPAISPTNKPTRGTGRNHEYFAGNMLFFLSGRCMNTKARPLNAVTFILTVLPAALFFAFSAPWLWHNMSPAIPIVFAYVFYITMSSFIHAAVSDPGILPRNMHPHPPNPDEERDLLTVGPATTEWVMVKTFPGSTTHRVPLPNRANTSAAENGTARSPPATGATAAMEVPTKYCKSCNIWRPPRAHHCRVCDACIETQDHHCVWLNNCVGRRNYRYFFSYVAFGSLLALMLLAFSITHVVTYGQKRHISFADSLKGRLQERVAFAMFLYAILALPYPGSLFVYHLFLIARGETTREYLNSHKFLKKDRHRPFSQSTWLRNWLSVLQRPRPPTYLQFKYPYLEGDLRFGHTLPKKQRKRELKKRYSVQGAAGGGANGKPIAPDAGVEMKQLPPLPPNTASTTPKPAGLTGPVDRTPR